MSLTLKVNFLKGWPCPSIVDKVANSSASNVLALVDEGKIGHLNAAGEWVLGIPATGATAVLDQVAQSKIPFILWNGAGSNGDQNPGFSAAQDFNQVGWGGIQGIALINQIEVETAQYITTLATPAYGDQLSVVPFGTADAGKLEVAVDAAGTIITADRVIVGICTKGVHKMAAGSGNVNMISFIPDNSKRLSSQING